MNIYEEYDEYIEEMLHAQYSVSEIFEHRLTRGEIREDFIKEQIKKQYPNIEYHKGIIVDSEGVKQSGQLDIIITKESSRLRKLGDHSIVNINECRMVMEVKSNAKGSDFTKFNDTAKEIKDMERSNDKPLCGIICYNIDMTCINLLNRFGYKYDCDIEAYNYDEPEKKVYNYIDFILCLDSNIDEKINEGKKFFIIRDRYADTYTLFRDTPVSKYFFRLFS